ncbi:PfkB family carbohydrate kinase [Streptomyces qinzhouensis]|uniref:PfkB family carbohydrate kinase n=1 Tax=Streptomyces qinzhouensis TaxID=2599401 RepID=UPI001FE3463B|nr:PfkB family carbohydrate kinase [Streptomyces qinzhouensis]
MLARPLGSGRMSVVGRLSVIGNISRDRPRYPDRTTHEQLGGAALLVALAAVRAGMPAAPVSVVGDDLAHLPGTVNPEGLEWSALDVQPGATASFSLEYDAAGGLVSVVTDYGVAARGTEHALRHIEAHRDDAYHLCCRRPLDIAALLDALAARTGRFSVDFFLPSAHELIPRAVPWLDRAATVFVNMSECRLLAEAVDIATLPELVITDGPRGARVLVHGVPKVASAPPVPVNGEVTGAGDTLAGTYLAHRNSGAAPDIALAAGVAAASAHLRSDPLPVPAPRQPRSS